MKFMCAISEDGFMAKNHTDNMSWTGPMDKKLFQLISVLNGGICLVSNKTLLAMPKILKGRTLIPVSRSSLPLGLAAKKFPDSLIIGGPALLESALTQNLINEVIVNVIKGVNLEDGLQFPLLNYFSTNPECHILKIDFNSVETFIYRIH